MKKFLEQARSLSFAQPLSRVSLIYNVSLTYHLALIFKRPMACMVPLVCLLPLLCGCDQPLPSPKQKEQPTKVENTKQPVKAPYKQALTTYHAKGVEQVEQALACVQNLRKSLPEFLGRPDATGLSDIFTMARHCHRLYQPALALTASYPALDARLTSLRRRIDSRPITPGYVDAIDGYPNSGIVNDPALPLTRENLIAEQGLTDAADVVLGFEVILFLLEGEHRYRPQLAQRDVSDYVAVDQWPEQNEDETLPAEDHPQNRRRLYLELVTEILEQDLKLLLHAWKTFTLPTTQEEAHSLAFAIVRNWHSVAVSLSPDDTGDVTDRLLTLITTPAAESDIARLMKLDVLEGWPRQGAALDPVVLSQSLGQWLVQQNR